MFYFLLTIVVGYVSYIYGVFAFCQIVGGIRAGRNLFAIVFWSILTIAICVLFFFIFNKYFWALILGLLISLVVVLLTPKIE